MGEDSESRSDSSNRAGSETTREDAEDDWFERALREEDDDGRTAGGDRDTDADTAGRVGKWNNDGMNEGIETGDSLESGESVEFDAGDLEGEGGGGDGFAAVDEFAGGGGGDGDDDDDEMFATDFGSALQDVDAPPMDATEGFDDLDFELGGQGETDFDEDLETDLSRIELGIEGLDRMIQGGVPERSLLVAIGSAGTGKTTFGLQFLNHGLEQGERAVFVTLEESRQRVINSATEKGYAFDEFAADGDLAVVDVDPVEMANSLASIRSELPGLIDEFGASRLVLDSVSLLEMMYEDRANRRNEIYDFTKSLKEAGVTAMLTSEAAEENPYASRYGIVEYLTDAVFVLQYVRPDDFRETRLAVEIQKIRDANHSREKKPYEITNDGISVHQQANLF